MVRHELGVNFMAPQKCHIMGPVKVTDTPGNLGRLHLGTQVKTNEPSPTGQFAR